eukprot:3674482-Amphidinium_carterae.1
MKEETTQTCELGFESNRAHKKKQLLSQDEFETPPKALLLSLWRVTLQLGIGHLFLFLCAGCGQKLVHWHRQLHR